MQAKSNLLLFLSIVFLSIVAFASCSRTKKAVKPVVLNYWQVNPVAVDGSDEDWSFKNYRVHDKTPMKFSFANDKDHLYILLKTSDQGTIMKMMTAGMQCWLSVSGKKQKGAGIRFPIESLEPLRAARPGNMSERREDPRAHQNDVMEKLIGSAREYAVQGFDGCTGAYLLKQSNKCGIVVRIGTNDKNELIWEASIPFGAFLKDSLTKEDLGKEILIGFEVNAMKEPEGMPGGPEGRGAGPGGGMGMPGGGGMGGGAGMGGAPGGRPPMGDNGAGSKQLFETTKVWQTIYLAYNG